MSENENIEARLCSYIEGDLDAQGRAEIEKYLLAHPQYLPLIAELTRTRGLLRDLPRASAPSELLETLSGQIERSALLGHEDHGAMSIGSGRMPQLAAVAAVLLLTGGLAAVIYRVLPPNKTQPELALLKPAPQPVNSTQGIAEESLKALPDRDRAVVPPPGEAPLAMRPEAPVAAPAVDADTQPSMKNGQDDLARRTSPLLSDGLASTSPVIASAIATADTVVTTAGTTVAHGASPQPQAPMSVVAGDATQLGNNLYLTLHATDEKAAGARITRYLSANRIQFESHALDSGARISSGPLPPLMPSSFAISATNSIPATPSAGVVTAPLAKTAEVADKGTFSRTTSFADKADAASPSQIGQSQAGNVIVAHNLTPAQARRLANDLAVNFPPDEPNPAAAMQSVAMDQVPLGGEARLQTGERLRIVAKDNALPGVEAMNEPQTIDAEGNLTLPLVGKLKAAGLTKAELAEKIPLAYHEAKSPTTATWTIDRLATTSPTTLADLSLTPAIKQGAQAAFPAGIAPVPAPFDKNRQPFAGSVERADGGAGAEPRIDVTISVVGQSEAATVPATQQAPPATDPATPSIVPSDPLSAQPLASQPPPVQPLPVQPTPGQPDAAKTPAGAPPSTMPASSPAP